MAGPDADGLRLRIERGRLSDEELAAVALVFRSLVLRGRDTGRGAAGACGAPHARAGWRKAAYRSPGSWR
ncbi:acyl-CoA carboxylase subunit epsilon [Streptomyces sp. GC420]|uniref:acyl-CoA carboxylase subunit epsilon n=1 Tax=Streptomyces sp. GC420 TaxID=2697568 RepID=UPI001414D66A|nr:acyl-CoA carboxylase subunit epsilon [Streptomyces sp. GC420]NBM21021.1 acyl-CoA carboxylase subunit epsilon [Streptomyces sp. GC420]